MPVFSINNYLTLVEQNNYIFYFLQLFKLDITNSVIRSIIRYNSKDYSSRRLLKATVNDTKQHTRTCTRNSTRKFTYINMKLLSYRYNYTDTIPIPYEHTSTNHYELDAEEKKIGYSHNVNDGTAAKYKYYLDARQCNIELHP